MELSETAYNVFVILKRITPLMDGLDSATNEKILEACQDIVTYLEAIK